MNHREIARHLARQVVSYLRARHADRAMIGASILSWSDNLDELTHLARDSLQVHIATSHIDLASLHEDLSAFLRSLHPSAAIALVRHDLGLVVIEVPRSTAGL